jgi:hypothetical protein
MSPDYDITFKGGFQLSHFNLLFISQRHLKAAKSLIVNVLMNANLGLQVWQKHLPPPLLFRLCSGH